MFYYAITSCWVNLKTHDVHFLAETDVPYEKQWRMEQANEGFSTADPSANFRS